jgi:hypothetical protein
MSAIPAVCTIANTRCAGLYIDLDADGNEEFVLLMPHVTQVFRHAGDSWTHVADGPGTAAPGMDRDRLLGALQRGEVGTQPPQWPDLRIGERRIDLHATAP